MMDFITLAIAVVAFIAGGAAYHFKTSLEKWYASKKSRPFFKVAMEYDHGNTNGVESMVNGVYPVEININADFNEDFIQRLDSYYISKGDAEYNPMSQSNEKVLIYIYDVVSSIADPILGDDGEPPMGDDIENIPPLAYRGGMENKTVVDISNPDDPESSNQKEFYGG